MKKQIRNLSLLVVLVASGIYGVVSCKDSSDSFSQRQKKESEIKESSDQGFKGKGSGAGLADEDPTQELNEVQARRSLKFQFTVLNGFYRGKNPVGALVDYLEKAGQHPVLTRSYNEYTGEMVIIRTNSPFRGTRYFHVQAFTDENGDQFIQHMSVEFRPGKNALSEAQAMAQEIFKVAEPRNSTKDFKEWELPGGYVLWMKQFNKNDIADMADDEFNTYSVEDVGAVRIAIEQDPHHE